MIPLMSKKQISIFLILGFYNCGFFGLREFFDLHSMA
jgi:hypothetical protein